MAQARAPTTMVTVLPLPAPVEAPLAGPTGPTSSFQAAKYFTIVFFVASVGVVIIIALCMFCRCCGRMRSTVQPLGPNISLRNRRRHRLAAVQPLEPLAEIVRKRGVIVEHPAGDVEMALRDLSVSSMKHPALAKESASYTTLEMPSDIVIIPVAHLSCPPPPHSSIPAHNPEPAAAPGHCWQPDSGPQPVSASARGGITSQVTGPGLLDTAAIAGILDTANDLPDHPPSGDMPRPQPGQSPVGNAQLPAAVLDTATSTQALLSTQQHESLQQWRQESHPGPSHHEAQEATTVPPAVILETVASSANPRATQQQIALHHEQQRPVPSDMAGEAPSPAAAASRSSAVPQAAAAVSGLLSTQQHEDLQQWHQDSQAGPVPSASQDPGSNFQPSSLARGAPPLLSTLQHEDLQQWRRETDPALQPVLQQDAHQSSAPGHVMQADDNLHQQHHTSHSAQAEPLHERLGARLAAAGVISEPAASPPHTMGETALPKAGHAAAAAPSGLLQDTLPSCDTSAMTGDVLGTQQDMLNTATSIQGLLSTQQHEDMEQVQHQ